MAATSDYRYLDAGIYTVPSASRLISATQARVRGWIAGHPHSDAPPIIRTELPKVGRSAVLSFTNLIEAFFVNRFADLGVTIQGIRAMAETARDLLDDEHPFAKEILFKTDRRDILAEIVDRAEKRTRLINLRSRNWELRSVIAPFLDSGIRFGNDGYPQVWYPRRTAAPNVVVTPNAAFGRPVLARSGVPTDTLVDALHAEKGNYKEVAYWYEVTIEEVEEAERFETTLAGTA